MRSTKGIPYIVIIGTQEMNDKTCTVKYHYRLEQQRYQLGSSWQVCILKTTPPLPAINWQKVS